MGITKHTPERVEAIMTAWRTGATYGEMAKRFDGFTKNIVAGIVERNKKTDEKSTRSFFAPSVPANQISEPKKPASLPSTRLAHRNSKNNLPQNVAKLARTTSGAHFRDCQWIAEEPSADDICKCGATTGDSRVYCPAHEARVWRVPQSEAAV